MKTSLKETFMKNESYNDNLFYNSLIEELNKLMEDELSKNYEDINAEIIDDCCNAISTIYELQNGVAETPEKTVNINNVIKKYNLRSRRRIAVSAACAAVAIICVGATTFSFEAEKISEGEIVKSAVGSFVMYLRGEEQTTQQLTTQPSSENTTIIETQEQTSKAYYTEPPIVTELKDEITSISVIIPPGFRTTVNSKEDISLAQAVLSVIYNSGKKEVIYITDEMYEICEPSEDGLTEIKICYKGVYTSLYMTVISDQEQNPVTINSIYGVFENSYRVEEMQVFAVYSDGTEKEIPKSDCTISVSEATVDGETKNFVLVEYENCTFRFASD